ncbi:MAG: hypothetical protein ACWGNV_07995 [Bacteroidales bacterium]
MELPDKKIEEMVQRKLEGESYTRIRKELSELGLTEQEVHRTIRSIDEKVLQGELNQKAAGKSRQWYRTGLFLATLGLILTLGANRGIILTNIPRWIIYTPFFGGIALMLYGRYSGKKKPESRDDGPSPIRRKRPYK